MKKKLIAIIAIAVAIVIIAVVAVVLKNNEPQPAGKDMDASGGTVENVIDDSDSTSDIKSDDSSSSNSSSNNNDNSNSGDKAAGNDSNSQNDQGSTVKPSGEMDYETFIAMSPSQQQKYMESFKSIDKFFKWYNKAKKKYEKEHPDIEIDDDPIELE